MNWYKQAQINGGQVKYMPEGYVAILGKNVKPGEGPWRISYLWPKGTPWYHIDFPSYEEALETFNNVKGEIGEPDRKKQYELV